MLLTIMVFIGAIAFVALDIYVFHRTDWQHVKLKASLWSLEVDIERLEPPSQSEITDKPGGGPGG